MASRHKKFLIPLATLAVFGCGYFAYTLFAAQAQKSVLAQAPLNTQVQVPPAFIMAVDDSGSMTFETMFPGRDGYGCTASGTNPFFSGSGVLRTSSSGTGHSCNFHHLFPYPGHRIDTGRYAIPPIGLFGFARSPTYNPSYFNPDFTYLPWVNYNGASYPQASITETMTDPRYPDDPHINMTDLHRDRVDDADPDYLETNNQTYNSGTFFPAGIIYRRNGACGGLASTGTTWQELTANVTLSQNCNNIAIRRPQAGQPATDELFRVPSGTSLPAGTVYYRAADTACGGLAAARPTQRIWVTLPSAVTLNATCDIGIEYYPATFYLPVAQAAPPGYRTGDAYRPVVADACGAGCDLRRYEIRVANYLTTAAYEAAIQNFANWFSYYGNRNRAMIAGMSASLVNVQNMRVGYFTINQHGSRDQPVTNAGERVTMFDMSDNTVGGHKSQLYDAIFSLPASGSTPNRQAVNAIGQQFMRTDAGAPVQLSCQKNAGMLFTDGYSNQDGPSRANEDGDGNMGVPFQDSHSNTMADIAAYYYNNNLRPGLTPGNVPVPKACPATGPGSDPKLDCNRNPHMSFYGVTLGARGNLLDPDLDQDPYTTPAIYDNWPSRQNDNPSTVDDIWHATVNTRGDFINAKTPADITTAMRRILATVSSGASPSGSIAITGSRIGAGSLTVAPSYAIDNEGTDWSGTLVANQVRLNPTTRVPEMTFAWEASSRFPAHGSRRVFFTRNNTTLRFNAANVSLGEMCTLAGCTAAEVTGLGGTANLDTAVEYLLGNTAHEKVAGGPFRDRGRILGDIVNSSPVVSAPTDDYGYGSLGGTLGSSYRTYVQTTKANRRYMVYVGANGGMLHAFDGGLTRTMVENNLAPDGNGGREKFGYIPSTAVGHLGNLLFPYDATNQNDQKFKHRYYVDGPITVSDAYYGSGWSTVLVGTSGAGGRSVFALNVSSASQATGNFTASDRLWEISNLNTSLSAAVRANIGHVLGKPVVVPVRNTSGQVTWKAIFGNGYQSDSGKAVLFLVDIGTGTPNITMIEAQESSPGLSAASRNGLGNIVVVDRWGGASLTTTARDGYADTVYAADQQGALWKFDIRSASPANITVPLHKTQEHLENGERFRQPILGGLTAASGPNGGVMIYFGTGSFSFYGDPGDENLQSLYAINDTERGPTTATVALSSLVRYTVSALTGTDRTVVREASPPLSVRGWYVDLPEGERFVGYPEIAAGVVFMPTYSPAPDTAGCSTGGFNTLFGLNARTGAAALGRVRFGTLNGSSPASATASVGLDTGGSAPVRDVGVLAIPRLSPPPPPPAGPPGGPPPSPPAPPEQGCWMMVSVAGAQAMYLPYPCGRQSWRQIQ